MENKKNHFLVGVFIFGVFSVFCIISYYISFFSDNTNKQALDIRFRESVTGINSNSPVFFNGVRVGKVKEIFFDKVDPNLVFVRTDIEKTIPITKSTKVNLKFQGLTGIAFIDLKGGGLYEKNLLIEAKKSGTIATIEGSVIGFNNILEDGKSVLSSTSSSISKFENLINIIKHPLIETANNTKDLTEILHMKIDDISQIISNSKRASLFLYKTSERINNISKDIEMMVSPDKKDSLFSQIKKTLSFTVESAMAFKKNIEPISKDISRFSRQGFSSIDSLMFDSGKCVQKMERYFREIEKNPLGMLFGNFSLVPEYDSEKDND